MPSVVKEQVVGHMSAILKDLDCVICLSLLKNPVSMGCGHFFCRYCITEVLKSNYRTPCPLCKRSFTRRSIQEADQRSSVILAASELAIACGQFTGVNFSPRENVSRENLIESNSSCLSFKDPLLEPGENCKPSTSKKRKSSESDINEKVPRTKPLLLSKVGLKASANDSNCASTDEDVIPASNKRQCKSAVDDDDDDDEWDLPSLDEILGAHRNSKSAVDQQQAVDEINHENQSPIVLAKQVTCVKSHIKTPCHTSDEQSLPVSFTDESTAVGLVRQRAEELEKGNLSENEKQENNNSKNVRTRGRKRGSRLKSQVALRNKKNALKNRTNQLAPDEQSTSGNSISKIPTARTKSADMNEDLAKENQKGLWNLFESPSKDPTLAKCTSSTASPSDLKILGKKNRQTKAKNSKPKASENATADSSAEEEALITKLKDAADHQLTVLKETALDPVLAKDDSGKECYNLSEINIPYMDANECDMAAEQPPQLGEGNSKSYRITDTAVSVQSVTSPVTSKLEVLSKSPGWSKVRQVGKDFRMRKFSKLSIEKNSSSICPMDLTTLEEDQNKDNLIEKSKFSRISDRDRVGGNTDSDPSKLEATCKNIKPFVPDLNSPQSSNQSENLNAAIIVKAADHSKGFTESNYSVLEENTKDVHNVAEDSNKSESNETSIAIDQVFDLSHASNTDSSQNKQKELNTSEEISEENGVLSSKDSCIGSADAHSIIMHERDSIDLDMNRKCVTFSESVRDINSAAITNIKKSVCEKTNDEVFNKQGSGKFCKSQEYASESRVFDMDDNYGVENEDLNNIEAMEVDVTNKQLPRLFTNDGDAWNEDQIIKQTDLTDIPSPPSIFRKQDFTKMQGSDFPKIRKDKILPSKFSKISKCQFTATESFFDEDENIYFAEHSQQTSQRLLEFCGNNNGQHRGLATAVTRPDVSLYSALNIYNKEREPYHNQIALLNKPGFAGSERTKVLKRTCLTLDEIQDAFAVSNKYGRPEAICSLPFSSGKFRLQIDVADETLNVSVLEVLDSVVSDGVGERTALLFAEKNIQTSSSLPVPLTILPSSNAESESSQPDNGPLSQSPKPAPNPFPYLSQYFSDTESIEQCSDTQKEKEMQLNESEVIPYLKPVSNGCNLDVLRKEFENENMLLSDDVASDYQQVDTLHSNVGRSQFPNKKVVESDVANEFQDREVPHSDVSGSEFSKRVLLSDATRNEQEHTSYQDDMAYDLPATQPANNSRDIYESNEQKQYLGNSYLQGVTDVDIEKQRVDTLHPVKNITDSDKPKIDRSSKEHTDSDKLVSVNEERSDKRDTISSSEEHEKFQEDNFQSSIFRGSATTGKSYSYAKADSGELSSDPDMALATELVAPLKNIAEKMNASGCKSSDSRQEQMSSFTSGTGGPLKQKRPLEIFEELVLSKKNDSFGNNLLSQRPSRLSLKSKRNSRKFKRIKKCNSSDDSDSSEAESTLVKNSTSSNNCKEISPTSLSAKNSLPSESLPGHCTLNSFLSEDMTNANSSEIAMEIEDLDKKILSVVEKLKKCGHADVLDDKNAQEATTTCKKNSPKAAEDCAASDDSENSIDIFSVPPTPPNAVPSNNDSTFKTAHCNN